LLDAIERHGSSERIAGCSMRDDVADAFSRHGCTVTAAETECLSGPS
jgi:hypothetical protein